MSCLRQFLSAIFRHPKILHDMATEVQVVWPSIPLPDGIHQANHQFEYYIKLWINMTVVIWLCCRYWPPEMAINGLPNDMFGPTDRIRNSNAQFSRVIPKKRKNATQALRWLCAWICANISVHIIYPFASDFSSQKRKKWYRSARGYLLWARCWVLAVGLCISEVCIFRHFFSRSPLEIGMVIFSAVWFWVFYFRFDSARLRINGRVSEFLHY